MKCNKILRTFKIFFQNSSIHGYHYLVDSKLHWSERYYWFLAVVLASGFGIYLMSRTVDENMKEPIRLTVDTRYLHWLHYFPAIVFCEMPHSITLEEMISYFNVDDSSHQTTTVMRDLLYFTGPFSAAQRCVEEQFAKDHCPIKNNFTEKSNRVRKKCNQILTRCLWMNKEFDCCSFFIPMNTVFGTCFGINSLATTKQMEYMLNFTYKDYPKLTVDVNYTKVSVNILTAEDTLTYRETSYGTVFSSDTALLENSEYDVYFKFQNTVNDEDVENIAIDIRGCRYPNENFLTYSKVYSYPACILEHYLKMQKENCSCNQHYLPVQPAGVEICNDLESMACIAEIFSTLVASASEKTCDITCVETEIAVTTTLRKDLYSESTTLRNAKARINFLTTPPTLRYHRRIVRDIIDLIVNVGGIGTLFFGCSVLSIVEIFYYLFIRSRNNNEDLDKKVAKVHENDNKQIALIQQKQGMLDKVQKELMRERMWNSIQDDGIWRPYAYFDRRQTALKPLPYID